MVDHDVSPQLFVIEGFEFTLLSQLVELSLHFLVDLITDHFLDDLFLLLPLDGLDCSMIGLSEPAALGVLVLAEFFDIVDWWSSSLRRTLLIYAW